MSNHDLNYKEIEALFPVIQNTICFKDRSFKVFVSSTCFDRENVSMVCAAKEFGIKYIIIKVIKGRAVVEFLAQYAVERDEQWNLEFPNENLAVIEHRE